MYIYKLTVGYKPFTHTIQHIMQASSANPLNN